jgi:CelD/BcsL family acetyltransferase involved in cellulose biosynthesis
VQATLHDIEALSLGQIETWNGLLAGLPTRSPFLSYAFCRAVHEARGGVRVLAIRGTNGEAGFLPFQIRRGRSLLRHGEQVGGSLSDQFGIIGNVSMSFDSQSLLNAANLSSLRFDRAIRELIPDSFQDAEKVDCVLVEVEDFDRFVATLTTKHKDFVKAVARSVRQLTRDSGPLSFELHAADPSAALETLMSAKRGQYRRTGVKDGLSVSWRARTLFRLLREPETSLCRPLLSTLRCNGSWIASNFGLLCGDTVHICYPVFDPQYRRYGPGHILFFRIFEQGVLEGIRRFDFGPGEASYKLKYDGRVYSRWKGSLRRKSLGGYSERILQACQWRLEKLATGWRQTRAAKVDDANRV